MAATRQVDLSTARRLAVAKQRLSGVPPRSSPTKVLDVVRSIRCVQLDPISVVARSPLLVLRGRLEAFEPRHLDRLVYRDRSLFEYWAHAASIVLSEDFAIHRYRMRRWPGDGAWGERIRGWIERNSALKRSIVAALRRRGPLRIRDLADLSVESWKSSGWTADRNVDQMIRFLWMQGKVMVSGRRGLEKWWDLAERVLPDDVRRQRLGDTQVARRAIELSLRCLGVGTAQHVVGHFTHGYPGVPAILATLEKSRVVERVDVVRDGSSLPGHDGSSLPGQWYVHGDDVQLLDRIERGEWEPRTTLLSPFDNLIHDRKRLLRMFDLDYRMEIYVPVAKRRYGYYAMPLLDGDRFIARVDPAFDRERSTLRVNSIVAEPGVSPNGSNAPTVSTAVRELATWLGATTIDVSPSVPPPWRRLG